MKTRETCVKQENKQYFVLQEPFVCLIGIAHFYPIKKIAIARAIAAFVFVHSSSVKENDNLSCAALKTKGCCLIPDKRPLKVHSVSMETQASIFDLLFLPPAAVPFFSLFLFPQFNFLPLYTFRHLFSSRQTATVTKHNHDGKNENCLPHRGPSADDPVRIGLWIQL